MTTLRAWHASDGIFTRPAPRRRQTSPATVSPEQHHWSNRPSCRNAALVFRAKPATLPSTPHREDRMGWKTFALGCAVATVALAAVPAEAAKAKKHAYYTYGETRSLPGVRTRVLVTRRSYLDAGTEVTPGTRKYLDYVTGGPSNPMDPMNSDWPSTFYNPYGRSPLPGSFFPWP